MGKEKIRKCVGCFELKNTDELIKITREHDSKKIFINPNTKIFGRSVYLCYNKSCIMNSLKKNKLAKFLKARLSEEITDKLQTFYKD